MEPGLSAIMEDPAIMEEALVTPLESSPGAPHRGVPLRSASDPPVVPPMAVSSTPLGNVNAARRPAPRPVPSQPSAASIQTGGLPQDMQAKLKAFHLSRQGAPPASSLRAVSGTGPPHASSTVNVSVNATPVFGGVVGSPGPSSPIAAGGPMLGGFNPSRLAPQARPQVPNWSSAPIVAGTRGPPKPSLGARRGLNLPGGLPGRLPGPGSPAGPRMTLNPAGAPSAQTDLANGPISSAAAAVPGPTAAPLPSTSLFHQFSNYVDTQAGALKFAGKAVIHGKGVDFSSGSSFSISLDEVENLEELGKGNYGTVYRVRHSRPQIRRPGLGLKGNRRQPSLMTPAATNPSEDGQEEVTVDGAARAPARTTTMTTTTTTSEKTSGIIMAMKEIHLELDEAKFAAIIMELDVLHRCTSPFIVDFYGAFFQEGAVYICMEYMDGGSVDKLYRDGMPEHVLRKVALSTVMGLKALKDDHNIIHRDVKPTNILVNTRGHVKICDFGVSGNLVASIAKTNIGCQSYMAPERIASGGVAQAGANPGGSTYSVQSDIWSLGLTIIECAMGRYPYAPETYNNIFSQLSAIVDGEPPDLPEEGFTATARDFVRGCLNKIPKLRPNYPMLLRHPWFSELLKPSTIHEADEEATSSSADADADADYGPSTSSAFLADEDVARWVCDALEKRSKGGLGKRDKPALHAAPLDARAPSVTGPGGAD